MASTAAAVVGASVLTTVRPGLGWLVAALAGTAALGTAAVVRSGTSAPVAARSEPTEPRHRTAPPATGDRTARPGATGAPGRVAQVAWAAATVALVAVGTFRAAGWLFALCVLAAVVTGTSR